MNPTFFTGTLSRKNRRRKNGIYNFQSVEAGMPLALVSSVSRFARQEF